jgi:lamin tail-like protein
MKATRIFILLLVWQTGFSQWSDNFGDGDFTLNPAWSGTSTAFIVENSILRLSAPAIGGNSYLSTPSENINDATWQFRVQFGFNPSGSNYAKVYLVANDSVLSGPLNGYFIKIGGSADEISLYRQEGLVETKIIDGTDGRLSSSTINVQVQVSRSASGQWQLSSKLDVEIDWFVEGGVLDSKYFQSSFFGIACIYTATRSTKFYFDDISVTGEAYVDVFPPQVDTIYTSGFNFITLEFNESLENSSALITANYLLNNNINPLAAMVSGSKIELEFASAMPVINILKVTGVKDLAQNEMAETVLSFTYIDPQPVKTGEIIVNEIMADPTPREDLPEVEWVELYNTSDRAIDMTGWSLNDRISSGFIENFILLPDSFLILSKKSDLELMNVYGNVSGLSSWPSLNNANDSLTLLNRLGEIMEAVVYDISWYRDVSKASGGWSIERINPNQPCSGYLNWQASTDFLGGTPGTLNSVFMAVDNSPPEVLYYKVVQDSLLITFDEPIDTNLGEVSIIPVNTVLQTVIDYNTLLVVTGQPFVSEELNSVVIGYVSDCFNNRVDSLTISFTPDFDPPKIDTVYSEYPNAIEIYFSEAVLNPVADNFSINPFGKPVAIVLDIEDQSHVTLHYPEGMSKNENYEVNVAGVVDLYNNMTNQSLYMFNYEPLSYPRYAEVLITEIMADPSPSVNLPESEYIELSNQTSSRLLLKGLILADAKDEIEITTGIIEPFERIILTKTSAREVFSGFSRAFGIPNWPTLNNSGDQVAILDPDHQVIHQVTYANSWYDDDEKAAGGWSLELVDEANFCGGDKVWTASNSIQGGTPGEVNSIQTTIPDLTVPHIIEGYATEVDTILLKFDESLTDQLPMVEIANLSILSLYFSDYSKDELLIIVEPLQPRTKYELSASKLIDCAGNINDLDKVSIFLPEIADKGDVVLSEILFNPRNDGVDFIEVYNNSAKNISLSGWQWSNGSSTAGISSSKLLAPYSFRVFTSLPENIITEYPNAVNENIYQFNIPSLINEKGKVVLHNGLNVIQDSVSYNEDWHFPYLANVDGISLERIDFGQPAYLSSNWASASSLENYATPGYRNSQTETGASSSVLSISPKVIVPDANGRDDFTTISLNQPGAMASIMVYNIQGQPIKQLANNSLIGSSSNFAWDGTDTSGAIVSLGHYIIVIEVITSSGNTKTYRDKVVVGTGF